VPTISIQASDTLFFRDGRPFSMGDDSFAQGIFPPPPSVLYGALRSAYISEKISNGGAKLTQLISESDNLNFDFIAFDDDMGSRYFPMPKDLIVPINQKKDYLAQTLQLIDSPKYSNSELPQTLISSYSGKTVESPHLMDTLTVEKYLNGETHSLHIKKLSDFVLEEYKIGIGRDRDTRTASEGKLFRIQANRLTNTKGQKLYFILGYNSMELSEKGWLTLGGERRIAYFEKVDNIELKLPKLNEPRFKIYISTPAVFNQGWLPGTLLKKYNLKLITAAIDRPMHVGGWDIEKRQPKPMLQCVPAGSVFYVEAQNLESARNTAEEIHGKCISDNINDTNYQAMGFGIAYIGRIPSQS